MRVGLSWDLDRDDGPGDVWRAALAELAAADGLGFDSAWLDESRDARGACPSPALLLTYASRRTSSIGLRPARRRIARDHPVRVAEEIAVLDTFSRGRAGVCFAGAGRDAAAPGDLHERIDFVLAAWTADEIAFRGSSFRFPSHIGDDGPSGASAPRPEESPYVPQWERGPATPDHLSVTPKPYGERPPVWVEVDDDETLAWAASSGVSPYVGADLSDEEAIDRCGRYRAAAREAGRPAWTAEPVIERRFELDGDIAGVVARLRRIAKAAGSSHLVWRRDPAQTGRTDQLMRFASDVQPLLQT